MFLLHWIVVQQQCNMLPMELLLASEHWGESKQQPQQLRVQSTELQGTSPEHYNEHRLATHK